MELEGNLVMSSDAKDNLIKLLVILVLLPFVMLYQGLVVHIVWNWFVPRLGGPEIGLNLAIGLGILVGLFARRAYKEENLTTSTLGAFAYPTIALGFACVVQAVA